MITNVSIHRGEREQYYAVGGKLVSGDKETDVTVTSIHAIFGTVVIRLSDGVNLIFKGFPYSYANGQRNERVVKGVRKNTSKRA